MSLPWGWEAGLCDPPLPMALWTESPVLCMLAASVARAVPGTSESAGHGAHETCLLSRPGASWGGSGLRAIGWGWGGGGRGAERPA